MAKCPPETLTLWSAYLQLSNSRPAGFGPSGIPLSEIEAWQRLMGVRLTPWEVETIIELDALAIRKGAEKKTHED